MDEWMFDTHNFKMLNEVRKICVRDLWEIGHLKLDICVDADVLGLICQSDTQRSQRMGMILLLVSDRYAGFDKNGFDTLLSVSKTANCSYK